MNKKIKKISYIALFSTTLGIGLGLTPILGEQTVYAESIQDAESIPKGFYKTPIDNVFIKRNFNKVTEFRARLASAIQESAENEALVFNINNPFFDHKEFYDDDDESFTYAKLHIAPESFVVKHDFKKGDKIVVTQTYKDPLKLKQLDKFEGARKDIYLVTARNLDFIFYDEDMYDMKGYTTPDYADITVNEDNTAITYRYEITVPSDSKIFYPKINSNFFDERNYIDKGLHSFKQIESALEDKDVVNVVSSEISITDEKGSPIVKNFVNGNVRATKDERIEKEESTKYFNLMGLTFPFRSKETSNQGVNANVLNGGITGGIVSTEVGKDLSIEDVDFGKLAIGKEIKPIKESSMVSVRDWTGGNGWKLTAQHKNSDRNKSLQLGVQVNNGKQVDLNNEANLVTEGESQLDTTVLGGEYSAKWGTHPTVGEFNNVIEWNLSANVNE